MARLLDCAICKTPFRPTHGTQSRFCSMKCRDDARLKHRYIFLLHNYHVETDACIQWPSTCKDDYAKVFFNGKNWPAHRIAWELSFGPIPVGMDVLHHCDNPRCFNPRHLFLGTDLENSADKVAKRRHIFGERVALAKLNPEEVRKIRLLHSAGVESKHIAQQFGVWTTTIYSILHKRTWGWVE